MRVIGAILCIVTSPLILLFVISLFAWVFANVITEEIIKKLTETNG